MLTPHSALLLVTLELKLNLYNVLKAFCELWLPESRSERRKSRVREDASVLGIEFACR